MAENQDKQHPFEPRPLHMCELLEKGLMEERDRRSAKPRFRCAKCLAEADQAQYLCQPQTL